METDRLTVQFLSENEKNRFEDSIDLAELESNINKISFKECQELAADIIINRVNVYSSIAQKCSYDISIAWSLLKKRGQDHPEALSEFQSWVNEEVMNLCGRSLDDFLALGDQYRKKLGSVQRRVVGNWNCEPTKILPPENYPEEGLSVKLLRKLAILSSMVPLGQGRSLLADEIANKAVRAGSNGRYNYKNANYLTKEVIIQAIEKAESVLESTKTTTKVKKAQPSSTSTKKITGTGMKRKRKSSIEEPSSSAGDQEEEEEEEDHGDEEEEESAVGTSRFARERIIQGSHTQGKGKTSGKQFDKRQNTGKRGRVPEGPIDEKILLENGDGEGSLSSLSTVQGSSGVVDDHIVITTHGDISEQVNPIPEAKDDDRHILQGISEDSITLPESLQTSNDSISPLRSNSITAAEIPRTPPTPLPSIPASDNNLVISPRTEFITGPEISTTPSALLGSLPGRNDRVTSPPPSKSRASTVRPMIPPSSSRPIPPSDVVGAISSLQPGQWLSSTAIQLALDNCCIAGMKIFDPSFLSSHWPRSLDRRDAKGFWVFPLQLLQSHWALLIVDLEDHSAEFWNSVPSPEYEAQAERILQSLKINPMPTGIDDRDWKFTTQSCPTQSNGYDCGVYAIIFLIYKITCLSVPYAIDASLWRHLLCVLIDGKAQSPLYHLEAGGKKLSNPALNIEAATLPQIGESLRQKSTQVKELLQQSRKNQSFAADTFEVLDALTKFQKITPAWKRVIQYCREERARRDVATQDAMMKAQDTLREQNDLQELLKELNKDLGATIEQT